MMTLIDKAESSTEDYDIFEESKLWDAEESDTDINMTTDEKLDSFDSDSPRRDNGSDANIEDE